MISMKNLVLLFFIISFKFSFGQSDYVPVKKTEKNLFFYYRTNVKSYDSINDITIINLSNNIHIVKLLGKWKNFNRVEYQEEKLISHCPILIDKFGGILELGIFEIEFHGVFTGSSNSKKYLANYPKLIKRLKGKILNSQIDNDKNYSLYKVKMPSRFGKKEIYTSYHFIGIKNNYVYRMALYNIDETNFENFDKFLIDTYNNN